ncbi:hypothetical protein JMUB5056_1040 [Leptotrichia hongkongensis]|jgi:hypothetical protein|uniref:NlpC/P60 domain-containing protein n=1 Tax=Leptotrichia hongkongensis TaxID=554406 RepID=A0A510L6M7_9FUSO|nr:type IV secretion system protein [Leptotrichia hongkongensis]BBM59456.1 hypothetical protein JMUB5056_1040 [Leptotrichia hongkongensis]
MKKFIFSIFLLVGTLIFANKGTYDVTKYRQDVVNYAMSNLGRPYSNDRRMNNGWFDCSSYINRGAVSAGMKGGVDGKSGSSGTTATIRASGSVSKISFDKLKSGDTLNFAPRGAKGMGHVGYIIENLGNGKFKMAHASSSRGTVVDIIDLSGSGYWAKRYIGATSAEQVLINNGYTPVNSDGTVAIPPAGSAVGAGAGYSGNNISSAATKSSLMVDWDTIQNDFVQMIDEGLGKLTPGLLVLLSVLTVLEIMWVLYGYIAKNSIENVWLSLIRIAIRFSVLAYFIPNAIKLINMGYEIFSGIGSYFMGNSGTVTLNSIWAVAGREAAKVLKIIGESNFNFWNLVTNQQLFFEELAKIVLLFGIILLIYYFVIRILFHMLMAVLQFRMALGLSWIFLPFDVNSITKRDLGNKALTTFFLAGTKIVVVMAMSGIIFKNLDTTSFGEITFKELEFQSIFLYITVGMVMAFVMNKVDDIVITLARN